MSYKPNDSYYAEFTTQRFDTGAATDADSLPTATMVHNGSDDGAVTLTVTHVDTGRYKVTGIIPSGYAKGDVVQILIAATVNSVAGKEVIDSFVLDSKRVGDLQDASVAAIQSGLATSTALTTLGSAISTYVSNILGTVANLNNLTGLLNVSTPLTYVIPASGSVAFPITITVRDSEGNLVDADASSLTVTAKNLAGSSMNSRVSSITHTATGVYDLTFTVESTDTIDVESLSAGCTVGGDARFMPVKVSVLPAEQISAIATILSQANLIGTNGADSPNAVTAQGLIGTNLDATISSRLAASAYTAPPAAAAIATAVWQDATAGDFTVNGSIGSLLSTAFLAIPEPATGTPPTTPTPSQALAYLYAGLVNNNQATATTRSLANSAGTVLCSASIATVANTSVSQGKLA